MQQDTQLWSDLLWCSSGKLKLPKCGYHMIYYDFHNNGLPYMRHSQATPVKLTDANEAAIPAVKSKNIFKPRQNLGHHKAPATGQYNIQYEEIMKNTPNLSNALVCTGVTHRTIPVCYMSPHIAQQQNTPFPSHF